MVMSSNAMWYKNGNFYEVPTTHIDFFLQNPELLGFTQTRRERYHPLGWLYELP